MSTIAEGARIPAPEPSRTPAPAKTRATPAPLSRLRLDGKLVGRAPYLVPLLVLAAAAPFAVISREQSRMIVAALEVVIPLVAGLSAASVLAGERSVELQLATPRGFRLAALRRLALIFAASAVISCLAWVLTSSTGLLDGWRPTTNPLAGQLTWLSSLSAFTVAGGLLGVGLRSRTAAAGLLAVFWIVGLVYNDVFLATGWLRVWYPFMTTYAVAATDWLATRLCLLANAGGGAIALAVWLGAAEWLLGAEDRS